MIEYHIVYLTKNGKKDVFWVTAPSKETAIDVFYEKCPDVERILYTSFLDL